MNILLIIADQFAANQLGCYGSPVPSTPNLDRLASRGMRFDRCYATHPTCAPNRATMLTGRTASFHGINQNNVVLQGDTPTIAHVLQDHAYQTAAIGKFHQTPHDMDLAEDLSYLGFAESVQHEDPKWGPWLEWVAEREPTMLDAALGMCASIGLRTSFPADWVARAQRAKKELIQPRREAGYRGMYVSPLPAELHDAVFVTEKCLDFVDRASQKDNPWFCTLSYVDPHGPYDPPEPYAELFKPEDMPPALPAEWQEQGPAELDDINIRLHKVGLEAAAIPRLRSLFHGSVALLDEQIGRVIDHLDKQALWEDTIVLFTTDHGELLGDHGFLTKGGAHYDSCVRVPLIVAGAGIPTGQVSDRLTCTLDFMPSLAEFAGLEAAVLPPHEGCSFAGAARSQSLPADRSEVSITLGGYSASIITDDGWRLTMMPQSMACQMFNLHDDPQEQHNLYNDPAHRDKREQLMLRFMRSMAEPLAGAHYRNMSVRDGQKHAPGRPDQVPRVGMDVPIYSGRCAPHLFEGGEVI